LFNPRIAKGFWGSEDQSVLLFLNGNYHNVNMQLELGLRNTKHEAHEWWGEQSS